MIVVRLSVRTMRESGLTEVIPRQVSSLPGASVLSPPTLNPLGLHRQAHCPAAGLTAAAASVCCHGGRHCLPQTTDMHLQNAGPVGSDVTYQPACKLVQKRSSCPSPTPLNRDCSARSGTRVSVTKAHTVPTCLPEHLPKGLLLLFGRSVVSDSL